MKKIKFIFAFICITLMASLPSHAAEGSGGDGSINNINILEDAVPVTITGTVSHYAGFNDAMVSLSQWLVLTGVTIEDATGVELAVESDSDLDLGEVQVYGLGPICYWDLMEATRPEPAVDVNITINAFKVTYGNGEVRYIAFSVVTEARIWVEGELTDDLGNLLELRSVAADTYGLPIWLVQNQGQQDGNEGEGGGQYNQ
jgi:hypothetical protein